MMKLSFTEMLSDEGKTSFSRVASGLLVLACIVWDTRIVWITLQLPDFAGQALMIGTLYGLNQVKSIVASMKPSQATTIVQNQPQTPSTVIEKGS